MPAFQRGNSQGKACHLSRPHEQIKLVKVETWSCARHLILMAGDLCKLRWAFLTRTFVIQRNRTEKRNTVRSPSCKYFTQGKTTRLLCALWMSSKLMIINEAWSPAIRTNEMPPSTTHKLKNGWLKRERNAVVRSVLTENPADFPLNFYPLWILSVGDNEAEPSTVDTEGNPA